MGFFIIKSCYNNSKLGCHNMISWSSGCLIKYCSFYLLFVRPIVSMAKTNELNILKLTFGYLPFYVMPPQLTSFGNNFPTTAVHV